MSSETWILSCFDVQVRFVQTAHCTLPILVSPRRHIPACLDPLPHRCVSTVLQILTFGSFELHQYHHHHADIRILLVHKTCRCHRSVTLIIILSSSYDHHYMIIILSSSSSSFIIVHNLTWLDRVTPEPGYHSFFAFASLWLHKMSWLTSQGNITWQASITSQAPAGTARTTMCFYLLSFTSQANITSQAIIASQVTSHQPPATSHLPPVTVSYTHLTLPTKRIV